MKLISWNVNGLRAIVQKFDFPKWVLEENPDFLCLQETKLQKGQIDLEISGYKSFWNYAEKKGYSGTVIFSKHEPLKITTGIGIEKHDTEGRVLTLEMEDFYLINVYTPNSQRELARIDYRMDWEKDFLIYINNLNKIKPIIICGDLNVAHKEIDLTNPDTNKNNPGFSEQERNAFTNLLENGFIDSFRYFYPDKTEIYSWWSYMRKARERNIGWRIDYFLVSDRLENKLKDALIMPEKIGSDHCPVILKLK